MNAWTIRCFLFLALIQVGTNVAHFNFIPPITIYSSTLTAKEGSCIEIKCEVTKHYDFENGYWFWLKDSTWVNRTQLIGTTVYSTNPRDRPVSPEFVERVTYVGSSSWRHGRQCDIRICNLQKTDAGIYTLRFIGKEVWSTKSQLELSVQDNPCLITFEKPHVVKESTLLTFKCSTPASCPSELQITVLTEMTSILSTSRPQNKTHKSTSINFKATWQDDGKEVSCQIRDNKDPNLVKKFNVIVEYAPRDTQAQLINSSPEINEGQPVTLICSTRGRPVPTITWYKDNQTRSSAAEWTIASIHASQSGKYHCEAQNKYSTEKSNPIIINVKYVPDVEIKMNQATLPVKEGDKMTLLCSLRRSNPHPLSYRFVKDGINVGWQQTYSVDTINLDDSGSYRCIATNSVGPGTSPPYQIQVQYRPRNTRIFSTDFNTKVKVGHSATLNCQTDAYPVPQNYSWYYREQKMTESSLWKTTQVQQLNFNPIERMHDGCYMCSATNSINSGRKSDSLCMTVLYPPTKPTLSVGAEVTEDQLITISCTVESNPPSHLILTQTCKLNRACQPRLIYDATDLFPPNTLLFRFNVTSTHAGFYECKAKNSEGSNSAEKRLVVKYRPKNVAVQARPGLAVNENKMLTLDCTAESNPPVTRVTWMKMRDGKDVVIGNKNTFTAESITPSDSGPYSCTATNDIGSGKSQYAEVKVKYAPKHTKILMSSSTDGTDSVTLSCSSNSFPPVRNYKWYRVMKDEPEDKVMSYRQNLTIGSAQPGSYYCIASNELAEKQSERVELFPYRGLMKALPFIISFLIFLLLILSIYLVRRVKSNHERRPNTQPWSSCFGFLGRWSGASTGNLHGSGLAEPFRSRDDLLPDQPYCPQPQPCRPHPDRKSASNVNTIYSIVDLPSGKGPSAQKPLRQEGRHTEDDAVNYASLHFGDKQKNIHAPKASEDDTYTEVFKPKPLKKDEQEKREDYENIRGACTAKIPLSLSSETDTSEEEEEEEVDINYSEVTFKAKPKHLRAHRDCGSSDEEELTQYSQVKIPKI
ncbi:hypothetical protein LDENG_00074480 [Lucifuga dentata]|nr:hypothetical protein LDENG_00074480 [Lucifuga dentata]